MSPHDGFPLHETEDAAQKDGDVGANRIHRNPQAQCITFPFGKRNVPLSFSHRPTGKPGLIWTYAGETCDQTKL